MKNFNIMKIVISGFLIITSLSTFSQLGNTMFGLARTTNPAGVYVATMNPATGLAANLGQTSVSSSINLIIIYNYNGIVMPVNRDR